MPMYDEHNDILNDRTKGVEQTIGVLARLFRQILFDLDVNPFKWAMMMQRYLDDPRNGIPRNSKDRSSARGNLNKELRRPKMTWKVFRKALMFLGPVEATFIVRLKWQGGKTTEHDVKLVTGQDPQGTPALESDDEE